jgi:hypothetical protein
MLGENTRMNEAIEGSCLCGGVRYAVTGPFDRFYYCHCSRCRKASGSAHVSNLFGRPENIRWIAGKELIRRFDLPTAERFSRCFCSECGTPVPHVTRNGQFLLVPAGALEGDPGMRPQANIFWRDRSPWYEEGLAAPRFDAYAS